MSCFQDYITLKETALLLQVALGTISQIQNLINKSIFIKKYKSHTEITLTLNYFKAFSFHFVFLC